ncbi:helix-turn-helix domain-containing protein [Methanocaldococcus indicus]|uniref:helix-turn-helix domain-containing protein n=1 Tax=Methanocaldococcus indicus TaxID=213231 RepID=UPI003C6CFB1E
MNLKERLLKSLLTNNFSEEFKKILINLNISLKEFSELSNIPYGTLYKVVSGKDFRVSTLIKILKTLERFESKKEENFIAIIAARTVLNNLTKKEVKINSKTFKIKEYPANTLEECIISAVNAEREGAKGIICAPIVSSTIEKIVDIPVVVIIPEKEAFEKSINILLKKI